MYLEKLELQGFKSFVNKTTLEFPQPRGQGGMEKRGLAAIVGPNGSGKSNLVDAIRWVTGEQSMKALRGKKSEDIIFSGTDKRARVGLAEVSLYLNNEDRQAQIDYSHIVITRRLYRSGESEYLLNRNPVRLHDINLLLAQASFGQKTYSIIGQGMVDAILSATPAERKEFFDEAAGIRHLQLKKDEALRKMVQVRENLRQGEALLGEIEPRLRSLVRQVKRLERREEVAVNLRQTQEQYYGAAMSALQREVGEAEQVLAVRLKEREAAEAELQKLEDQFATMEKRAPSGERFEALTKEHRKLWDAKGQVREKLLALKTELVSVADAPSGQTQSNEISRGRLLPLLIDLETARQSFADLVSQTELDKSALKKALERLGEHLQSLRRVVAGEGGKDVAARGTLEKSLQQLVEEEKVVSRELEVVEHQMREFQAAEDEKNKEFFALQREVQGSQQHVTALYSSENDQRVVVARLSANRESLEGIVREELGGGLSGGEVVAMTSAERDALKQTMDSLKQQLSQIGTIDPETAEEYSSTKERHDFLQQQTVDLIASMKDLDKIVADLDTTISKQFSESFHRIGEHFEHFFKILFGGGFAKLVKTSEPILSATTAVSEDDEDDESEAKPAANVPERIGIEIQATPPGKRLKSINMLSGGERALTSLALVCAIIANNPAPFVILDEVEAALDEANSAKLAEILDQLTTKTQFIVITHNRTTMHQANILYGVTMGEDGSSRVLSLKLEDVIRTEG